MSENLEERLLDLLCKQAIEGLTPEEAKEMNQLQISHEVAVDLHSLEMTAAAISLSGVRPDHKLPDHLKGAILARADEFFASKNDESTISFAIKDLPARQGTSLWGWLGWLAAAAACIALAVNIWVSRSGTIDQANLKTPTPTPEQLAPTQQRDRFIAAASDIVKAEWGPGGMAELKPAGDVVWSNEKQTGYLRVTGLPKNDPNKQTYQLWIVAENQDPKTPVDGGTFDISADGETVIPIDAKVKTLNPKAFAITIEKPGGVVVSKEKHAALAPVKLNPA